MSKPYVRVAAGLILDSRGRLLLGQRPDGKAWAGWWEFPGGKIEVGETVEQALIRELDEELGIQATQVYPWVVYVHEYPKSIVELAFCQVTAWQGEPHGRENQALDWVDPWDIRLDESEHPIAPGGGSLLPAAAPPLRWLRLPTRYRISNIRHPDHLDGWLAQLRHELLYGLKLVQFREPAWAGSLDALHAALQDTLALCRQHGARCLINSCHPHNWWSQADGVQLRAADAARVLQQDTRPPGWLGVSAHTEHDIDCARELQADFVVLGHVSPTDSHLGSPALGWDAFRQLAVTAGRPVFAIGGQSNDTLDMARLHGAHGVAAMRGPLIET
ncbi:Nudix family hydrolase [Castellaniella caeni]|uniref:Nudix family hydrolase n=1 Tax=Castellaniella caeni TaxID=266123 RepID=UPI00082B3BD8|nr:Nudix family hydrolase [Castellaniella caeni]